jgi:hypothetical protein
VGVCVKKKKKKHYQIHFIDVFFPPSTDDVPVSHVQQQTQFQQSQQGTA